MSIRLMSLVWDTATVGGSDLLVLLALADYANDDGTSIYPSMKSLAKRARLSEDQTRRIIHKLIADGVVELVEKGGWTGNRNKSNEYRIILDSAGNLQGGVLADCKDGTRVDARTVLAPVQEDPSLDPSLNKTKHNDDNALVRGEVIHAYESNIGVVGPLIGEQLHDLMDEVGLLSVRAGIIAAATQNKRSFSYMQKCARNHAHGVEKPTPKGGDYRPNRGSKVQASMDAVDSVFAKLKAEGITNG